MRDPSMDMFALRMVFSTVTCFVAPPERRRVEKQVPAADPMATRAW